MIRPTIEAIINSVNSCSDSYCFSVLDADSAFEAYNIDSIGFVRIVVALEKAFDCEIPDDMLILSKLNTINKIYMVLSSIYNSESHNDQS